MSDPGFVHLHVHSSYSLLEGALTIGKLAELAKADRQPALALTDTDNMFGALEFSDKLSGAGIQPIVGCALRGRFRRPGGAAPSGPCAQAAAPRPAGRARGRLPQPDAADLARLPRDAVGRAAAPQARRARGSADGPDRADRRSRRSARSRACGRARPSLRRRAATRLAAPVRRPALCRAAAP